MSLEKCNKILREDFPVFKKTSIDYLQTAQKTYLSFALQLHSELKAMFEQQYKKNNTKETKSKKPTKEIESKSYYSKNRKQSPRKPYYSEQDLLSLQASLDGVKHVLMVDLDNWTGFFHKLPCNLPADVVVFCFWGGNRNLSIETMCTPFVHLVKEKRVEFTKCGNTKNAADFGLAAKLIALDLKLKNVRFTIISGDKGFDELKNHMDPGKITRIDPHHKDENLVFVKMLMSISS